MADQTKLERIKRNQKKFVIAPLIGFLIFLFGLIDRVVGLAREFTS